MEQSFTVVCHCRRSDVIRTFTWRPVFGPEDIYAPCHDRYDAGHGRLVQTAVRLVPFPFARAVSRMGVALGRPDCASRGAVADVFRGMDSVATHPQV